MKRKALFFLIVLLIVALLNGCNASNKSIIEDLEYELTDGEVVITGYTGTDRKLSLPDEIADRPVTEIGAYAFSKYDMTDIELPKSITKIGDGAFSECKCLTDIVIPEGVTQIGEGAFYKCEALKKVDLPDSLQRIEDGAFNSCCALENINVADDLEYVGEGSFAYCDALCNEEYRLVRATIWSTEIQYNYDADGILYEEIYGEDKEREVIKVQFEYDSQGRVLSEKAISEEGEAVQVTTWEYFEDSSRKTIITSDSPYYFVNYYNYRGELQCELMYSQNGTQLTRTDYEYGPWNLERIIANGEEGWSDSYCEVECDRYGNITRKTLYDGNFYEYDGELMEVIEFIYDAAGNCIREEMIETSSGEAYSEVLCTYEYEKVK